MGKEPAVAFVVGGNGQSLTIYLDGASQHSIGYSGDVLAEFSSQQWQDECNRVATLMGKTPSEVSSAAFEGYIMAMDDAAFGIQGDAPEPPMPERLQIYVAVARIVYLLCQGDRLTTREAAGVMTRDRVTAWRVLKTIKASGLLPLKATQVGRGKLQYWEIEANRHLRASES